VETELLLRDIQMLDDKLDKITKQVRNDKSLQAVIPHAGKLLAWFNEGKWASTFPERDSEPLQAFFAEMRFITDKPVIYCANTDENTSAENSAPVKAVKAIAEEHNSQAMLIAARVEDELIDMPPDDRREFLKSYGITENGLALLVRTGYRALDLVSFFTIQSNQVQAWTVRRGSKAPKAAGVIHSDFEHGFIRAEVIAFDDFAQHGGEHNCRTAGVARTEGKDYEVRDGDIIKFLFHA